MSADRAARPGIGLTAALRQGTSLGSSARRSSLFRIRTPSGRELVKDRHPSLEQAQGAFDRVSGRDGP